MRKHNILIVDDEIYVLNSLKRLLRNEPYTVFTTSNPEEVISLIKDNNVSLIICDQRMPEITGLELLKEVKKLYPDTLRVIITGYTDFEVVVKVINEGEIYRFIPKPWNDEEVKLVIRHSLEQYDLTMDNKILLDMVNKHKDIFEEIKSKFPDVMESPKIKDGIYVINQSSESLENFMQKYFPDKDMKGLK